MDNIVFSLTRVSDSITDKVIYRANVQTNGTIGRDELAAQVTALNGRVRELEAELEEARGVVAKLTAQVNRDFENSSVPSSKQVARRKRVPNTREALLDLLRL